MMLLLLAYWWWPTATPVLVTPALAALLPITIAVMRTLQLLSLVATAR